MSGDRFELDISDFLKANGYVRYDHYTDQTPMLMECSTDQKQNPRIVWSVMGSNANSPQVLTNMDSVDRKGEDRDHRKSGSFSVGL